MMKRTLLICCLLISTLSYGQIDLTKSRIKVATETKENREAAEIFKTYIKKISGKDVAIIESSAKEKSGDIILGGIAPSSVTKDGYSISTNDNKLTITTCENSSGVIYGVCEVLERFFGVKQWAVNASTIPQSPTMIIPSGLLIVDNPAFEYRQTNGIGQADPTYKAFHHLRTPDEYFAENIWVHTFDRLLPASVYGEAHPEYYALINGERRPGKQSQLCLTNDDVFNIIAHKLDSIFKIDPSRTMISVSQNDGNATNCTCPKCKAIDEQEESLSGSIIYFMNKLAKRFPDKEISTLAYTYSVKPPKNIKPLPNVNIMLCDIDCMRHLPLVDLGNGKEIFVEYLRKWNEISDNIFVWDYGINFDNTVSPFPNFHILKDNIQLFRDNDVTKLFEQVNGNKGVDFSELRGYMISKLMWNPDLDSDELMREFVWGYYGDAAQPIYDYLRLQQGGLVSTGKNLWIYDSPVTHKDGFLNRYMMKEYQRLFDKAEEAVKDQPVYLDRVRLSRLPIQYAELEIARTLQGQDADDLRAKAKLFKERTAYFGIKSLNERSNDPQTYCDLYVERYLPAKEKNKAEGATIEWIIEPSGRYAINADKYIVDGLYGGTSFVESWIGWEGKDGEFIIDLGSEKEFSIITSDFLHQLGQWVFLPKGVRYEISSDKENFTLFGENYKPENQSNSVLFEQYPVKSEKPVTARYIKVKVDNIKVCPSWHYGIGHTGWTFIDEVTVL